MGKNVELWVIVGNMESRFRGIYHFSVYSKGRVNVPAKFRGLLKPEAHNTFIISLAPDGCLRIYPEDSWVVDETELISRRETPDTLAHKRYIYSILTDSTLDGQGRITLSQEQMEASGIAKEVTFVGMGNYIEIWDQVKYSQYRNGLQSGDFTQMHYNAQGGMPNNAQAGMPK
jgi:MraZ protein